MREIIIDVEAKYSTFEPGIEGRAVKCKPGDTLIVADWYAESVVGIEHAHYADQEPVGKVAPEAQIDASPAAVDLANEHGLNLADIQGTGSGGRIIQKDVEAAVEALGVDNS